MGSVQTNRSSAPCFQAADVRLTEIAVVQSSGLRVAQLRREDTHGLFDLVMVIRTVRRPEGDNQQIAAREQQEDCVAHIARL